MRVTLKEWWSDTRILCTRKAWRTDYVSQKALGFLQDSQCNINILARWSGGVLEQPCSVEQYMFCYRGLRYSWITGDHNWNLRASLIKRQWWCALDNCQKYTYHIGCGGTGKGKSLSLSRWDSIQSYQEEKAFLRVTPRNYDLNTKTKERTLTLVLRIDLPVVFQYQSQMKFIIEFHDTQ